MYSIFFKSSSCWVHLYYLRRTYFDMCEKTWSRKCALMDRMAERMLMPFVRHRDNVSHCPPRFWRVTARSTMERIYKPDSSAAFASVERHSWSKEVRRAVSFQSVNAGRGRDETRLRGVGEGIYRSWRVQWCNRNSEQSADGTSRVP
jgi:hypothetical protein